MKHLIGEIANFLGEPEPYEVERKILIDALRKNKK